MRPERDDLRPEKADFQLERTDLRPERLNLRLESPDLKPQRGGGQTDKRMNERMKVPCVLQDFVLFGAAALPLIPIYNHAKQGNGYR